MNRTLMEGTLSTYYKSGYHEQDLLSRHHLDFFILEKLLVDDHFGVLAVEVADDMKAAHIVGTEYNYFLDLPASRPESLRLLGLLLKYGEARVNVVSIKKPNR
jgi:hypothetical protein